MPKNKYDIFISYRREDGAQYSRILQLELEKRGYRVFLDYEELTDGVFGDEIKEAVKNAPIFMMVLTPFYLTRSMEKDSWVRQEIALAIDENRHFVPVDPDKRFNGIPSNTPQNIADIVSNHQHSAIDFGQALGATVDLMVKNRIEPNVKPKSSRKWKLVITVMLFVLAVVGLGLWVSQLGQAQEEIKLLKALAEEKAQHIEKICEQNVNWSTDITTGQMRIVCSVLGNMEQVDGGEFIQGATLKEDGIYDNLVCPELEIPPFRQSVETFFICKYEVSIADWGVVMQQPFEDSDSLMPKTNVTFHESVAFAKRLADLTGLAFRLPTEAEWEYAARGGTEPDRTLFAGNNNPEKVAWYVKNAKGKPHVCDASNSPLTCNALNLYDMSGNVAEWTTTTCYPYNKAEAIPDTTAMAVRGGNYDSQEYEITVFHREAVNPNDKDETIGLRLVIGKDNK